MTRPAPLVEYVTRRRPYGKPVASAAPRDEPTPPRRNQPAAESVTEPPKGRPLRTSDFAPDAVRLHQHIERLAARDSASGDATHGRGFVGVDEFGRRPEGAVDPFWRPPSYLAPRDGRRDLPIEMNGRTRYQQSPPTHVTGAVYGNERERRRKERVLSEDQSQRAILAAALAEVGGDVQRLPPDQLAALAKLKGPAAVARAKMGRRGKGRAV